MQNIQKNKLIALVLMLFPVIGIIGAIIYLVDMLKGNWSVLELVVVILTFFWLFFIPAILLWLNALGIISLNK